MFGIVPTPTVTPRTQKARDLSDFIEGKNRDASKKQTSVNKQIQVINRPKSSTDCLIIREDSTIHNLFEVLVTILCIFSGLVYANMAAFRIDKEGHH